MPFIKRLIARVAAVGSSVNDLAQIGHLLAGNLVVLMFHVYVPVPHAALWGAFAVDVAWGLPKEFWFDILYEGASWKSGWIDWRSYFLGSAAQLSLLYLRFHTL